MLETETPTLKAVARGRALRLPPAGVMVAATFLAICTLAAIFAPLVAPYDPMAGSIMSNLLPPGGAGMMGDVHMLGTDVVGRDVLSGIVHGARVSLSIGVLAVLGAGVFGTVIGIVSGYVGGAVDEVLMRIVDVQLAFPFLLLAILAMYALGQGFANALIVLIIAGWPLFARVARAEALRLAGSDFVLAARSLGASNTRILFRYILLNAMNPIIIVAAFAIPNAIIAEAGLSFLGVGMPAHITSWGSMLSSGRDYLAQAWWIASFPGLAIMFTVLSINIVSSWLARRLDPNRSRA